MQDKDAFFAYRSLPEIYRFQGWRPKDKYEIEAFIAKNIAACPNAANTWLQLAACLKDGQLIGDIGIHFLEDDLQVEIGLTISTDYQGKGYAAEAVKSVVGYLFSDLRKHRITASVDPDNRKSVRLLEKIGFRKEAHFVKSYRMDDTLCDDCIYAILEDQWK